MLSFETMLYRCEYEELEIKSCCWCCLNKKLMLKERLFVKKELAQAFLRFRTIHYPSLNCVIKIYHLNQISKEYYLDDYYWGWDIKYDRIKVLR